MLVARPGAGLATSLGVVSAIGGPSRTRWGGTLEGTIRTDATKSVPEAWLYMAEIQGLRARWLARSGRALAASFEEPMATHRKALELAPEARLALEQ